MRKHTALTTIEHKDPRPNQQRSATNNPTNQVFKNRKRSEEFRERIERMRMGKKGYTKAALDRLGQIHKRNEPISLLEMDDLEDDGPL